MTDIAGPSYSDGKLLSDHLYDRHIAKPILECHSHCDCPPTCSNRVIGQPSFPPLTQVFDTETKGRGLRAVKAIQKGVYVCEYLGEVISQTEAETRRKDPLHRNYILKVNEHIGGSNRAYYIDGQYYGSIARFVNHSCEPNLEPVIVRIGCDIPRIGLFARTEISAGEELTFCYGDDSSELSSQPCFCGMKQCKGFLPFDC